VTEPVIQFAKVQDNDERVIKRYEEGSSTEGLFGKSDAISLKTLLDLGKTNLMPEEEVSVALRQVLDFFGSLELA